MRTATKISILGIFAIFVSLIATTSVFAAVQLPAGMKVKVEFVQDVSSKYVKPGDLVPIKLVDDIGVGGITLVKAGAPGNARVVSVKKAGKPGKPGSVEVQLVELTPEGSYKSLDGSKIQLEAVDGPIIANGKSKKTMSWLLIFGLFIKGTEGVIPAGHVVDATVKNDVMISVE